jgi:hypothetical protein
MSKKERIVSTHVERYDGPWLTRVNVKAVDEEGNIASGTKMGGLGGMAKTTESDVAVATSRAIRNLPDK